MQRYFDRLHSLPLDKIVTETTVTALAKSLTQDAHESAIEYELEAEPETVGEYVANCLDILLWPHSRTDEALNGWKFLGYTLAVRDASNWQ